MKTDVNALAKMKQFKLIVHQPNFSEEDLRISPKDFPDIRTGDFLEIYHPENDFSRLLLQVTLLKEFQQKDTISVKSTIAITFQLRTYADVIVNKVNVKDVALDSAELTFKDQYLGRSDMWRFKRYLENTCAYLNKKIEFCGIRCEVYEMWAQGERVACGVITEDTKIVYRSSTSQVYLFIQMSSEMWDTDIHGDLYFEKAVNGFLADLFLKWKKNGSSHEVTIVLFSRTYYDAQSIEEFPEYMRECLQQDYKGRFYEDFYRVAIQNERNDDWTTILVELKRLFNIYPTSVLDYHCHGLSSIPKANNSTASQGNFLEVLNMSLNVFEKHYLDRSFDRTGQLSVVITPGVGVFEVDRELTNITKQRIIDNGVGSDLVCLGEQPLHAVPLFKFHNKNVLNGVDDYSMPHWINLSFYSGTKQVAYSTFVPRIKLPPLKSKPPKDTSKGADLIGRSKQIASDDNSIPTLVDYDAYDAQVFKLPTAHVSGPHTNSLQRMPTRKKSDQVTHNLPKNVPPFRKFSEADITLFQCDSASHTMSRSAAINIPGPSCDQSPSSSSSTHAFNTDIIKIHHPAPEDWDPESSPTRTVIGSAGSSLSPQGSKGPILRHGRALINPFDPSHVTIKLTPNRRRWTHVFPLGPTGIFMQQHHYQAIPHGTPNACDPRQKAVVLSSSQEGTNILITEAKRKRSYINSRTAEGDIDKDVAGSSGSSGIEIPCRTRNTPSRSSIHPGETISADRSLILLWGATGEQEWTPALTTGVDWKSLTIPACLPLTTDYFPDSRSLQNDYVVSDYTLLPEDVNNEIAQQTDVTIRPLTTEEVFDELVSQRLQQGFQQIVFPKPLTSSMVQVSSSPHNSSFIRPRTCTENGEIKEIVLSIGRIFHKVTLASSTITVTCFRPRHPYPTMNIQYLYRFQAPYMDNYDICWVNFQSEKLESYNWNYLDHYICWRGQGDFSLIESIKYWRFRMYLLPSQLSKRKMIEENDHCDCYQTFNYEDNLQLVDGFLKFLEVVNRLKKPFVNRKTRKSGTFIKPLISRGSHPQISVSGSNCQPVSPLQFPGAAQQAANSGSFRERLGSNRLPERPRTRSGSKVLDRVRSESGNGGRVSPAGEISDVKQISSSSLSLDTGTESLAGQTCDLSDEHIPFKINICSGSNSSVTDNHKLSTNSSLAEILEAMKQSNDGISFFSQQQRLPPMSFVCAEAALWIMEHVENAGALQVALGILENMLSEGIICHASGSKKYPLIFGFHLYYIVPSEKERQDEIWQPTCDSLQFEKEWVEVSIDKSALQPSSCVSPLLQSYVKELLTLTFDKENINETTLNHKSVSKECNLEMEPSDKINRAEWGHVGYNKINRAEWGHVGYNRMYAPNVAFELTVQWMVATSSIITEVVQNWSRKATVYGFHLIPVPCDPFAFAFSPKSDPLRGPIFIPLNYEVLLDDVDYINFQDTNNKEYTEEMFNFQVATALRFGFFPCVCDQGSPSGQPQFIHTTGSIFLMIRCPIKQQEEGVHIQGRKISPKKTSLSSPHESYITRHVMGKRTKKVLEERSHEKRKVGFYWSWNYMLTKRWRSNVTIDDQLANKIFRDFHEFCNNDKNRLRDSWQDWQQINSVEN